MSVDSVDTDSDISDINDENLKIPKPPGEAGRPGRGGYSLEQVLDWPPTRLKQFKKTIAKLINEHLNPTYSFSGQSLASVRLVREEALKHFPELGDYQNEWPITDAVKLRLKYTSARARKAAHITTAETMPREKRTRKSRKSV
ncbi:hypothetical protein C8Q77DRAFT_1069990 [Trametes polyzona]|nr:hypothetical protein C8Q77DRAFT_1069990 [Trametes polyzona]